MKNSILSQIKGNALFYISTLFLLVIVFMDPFSNSLTTYLKDQIESITLGLGLLVDLKTIAWAASSSHLPVVAGMAASTLDTFATAIKYLSWSDMLVTSQLLILTLSKTIILKILLILSLLGSLVTRFRTVSLKILVIVLLINPGLPAYVSCIKYVAQEAKLDSGDELTQELKTAHVNFQNEDKRQKAKTPNQGNAGENFLKGIEEKAVSDISKVTKKVEESVSTGYLDLKESSKKIKTKAINLFSTIIIQFILLPFLFFYSLFQLFKKILSDKTTDAFLRSTVKIQALVIIVIGILSYSKVGATIPSNISKKNTISNLNPKHSPMKLKSALGIDVSHFQGEVSWAEIKANNISFAYTKATEGQSWVDPKFQKNWSNMLNAEITRGVYHFYSSEASGSAQAQHFIQTVGDLKPGDLPPVIDIEKRGIIGSVEPAEVQKEVKMWLKIVEDKYGIKPIIYTNNPIADEYLNHPDFAEYLLWIAEYDVEKPKTPTAWEAKGWAIWQRTERGSIEGEIGNVDLDTSRVSLDGLVLR